MLILLPEPDEGVVSYFMLSGSAESGQLQLDLRIMSPGQLAENISLDEDSDWSSGPLRLYLDDPYNGSREFHSAIYGHILDHNPPLQYFFVACLVVQSIMGTVGNLMVIASVFVMEPLRHTGNAFIVNLAAADLCVTAMAQPANVIGALYGETYFLEHPIYCSLISTLCATGCLSSCWNICMIAVNRYILICKWPYYEKIYTFRNTLFLCAAVWLIIYSIEFPNHIGWGDLRFSSVFFLCTFANHVHSYAVFYIVVGVFTPLTIAFFGYLQIYLTVKDSKLTRNRILGGTSGTSASVSNPTNPHAPATTRAQIGAQEGDASVTQKFYDDLKIIYALFRVYVIFILMWLPLVALILIGQPVEIHHGWYIASLIIAHGNSSINWLVYAATIEHFRVGFSKLLGVKRKPKGPSMGERLIRKVSRKAPLVPVAEEIRLLEQGTTTRPAARLEVMSFMSSPSTDLTHSTHT